MRSTFKTGDKVISQEKGAWHEGLRGVLLENNTHYTSFLVEFPTYKGTFGHSGPRNDGKQNRWWLFTTDMRHDNDTITLGTPSLANDLRLPPQARKVLARLQSGKDITRLKAEKVFDIVNLPDCIHRIRGVGYDVETKRLADEEGRRYVSYRLAKKEVVSWGD